MIAGRYTTFESPAKELNEFDFLSGFYWWLRIWFFPTSHVTQELKRLTLNIYFSLIYLRPTRYLIIFCIKLYYWETSHEVFAMYFGWYSLFIYMPVYLHIYIFLLLQLFYSFFKSLIGKDVVVELKNDLRYVFLYVLMNMYC